MNVQRRNGVSIYCLSAGTALPEWLGDRARRNLSKRDESVRRRIELLQDFAMPASSTKLVQSTDGRYILAAGTYPPRIRCYDVHDLSLKFERYTNAAVVDMCLLGEDYGKVALLLDDRTVAFHAHYGFHSSVRIPTFGRAMVYEPTTCDLLVAAKGNQVYRINLDEGRFAEPWAFEGHNTSGTAIAVNALHPLASLGCDDGTVRFWDSRTPDSLLRPFLSLNVSGACTGYGYADTTTSSYNPNEISSIAHDPSGLYMAVGTGGGLVALYDVRSSRPLYIQEHKAGLPIHTVRFHSGSGMVLSSDEKLVKVWRYKSRGDTSSPLLANIGLANNFTNETDTASLDSTAIGALKVNMEGLGKFSHFIVTGDELDPHGNKSGVLLCATEQPKMESFYIPALGVAPKWCSFLDSITEELEERDLKRDGSGTGADDLVHSGQESVFENYKFVSRDDLEKLGISNLIGTPMLRGYMHGFFMDINLYNRVKAVANPFEYEEYQKKKLKERLDAKQSSRIAPRAADTKKRRTTAVNPELADRLEHKASDSTKAGKVAKDLLSDDRFGRLFTNPDYEIDQDDEDFKLRNPSGVAATKNRKDNMDSDDDDTDSQSEQDAENESTNKLNQIADDRWDDQPDEVSVESDSENEDGFQKVRGEAYEAMKTLERRKSQETQQYVKSTTTKRKKHKAVKIMREADGVDDVHLGIGDSLLEAKSRREELNMPLARRKAMERDQQADHTLPHVRVLTGGSKEVTYIPKDPKRKMDQNYSQSDERGNKQRSRRSVKDLGFKKPFRHHS